MHLLNSRPTHGRNPDQVRVLAVICPGLMALGAPMYHPAAPTGSPYTQCTQEQMGVASSSNKQKPLTRQLQTRHSSAHRNAEERHRLGLRTSPWRQRARKTQVVTGSSTKDQGKPPGSWQLSANRTLRKPQTPGARRSQLRLLRHSAQAQHRRAVQRARGDRKK
jgi:hypothetical protein